MSIGGPSQARSALLVTPGCNAGVSWTRTSASARSSSTSVRAVSAA